MRAKLQGRDEVIIDAPVERLWTLISDSKGFLVLSHLSFPDISRLPAVHGHASGEGGVSTPLRFEAIRES